MPPLLGVTANLSGTSDAIAPTCHNRGVRCEPGVRYMVTLSWYPASSTPFATSVTLNVSVSTKENASLWPLTVVRLMSWSPLAQRAITYAVVAPPSVYLPSSSTCSQVPAGVSAFHEATSWLAPNPMRCTGEVQEAYSHDFVPPVYGSA